MAFSNLDCLFEVKHFRIGAASFLPMSLLGGFRLFFSSRGRHTRSYGDWSSDVCSSDLGRGVARNAGNRGDTSATERTDQPPLQTGIQLGIELLRESGGTE